MLTNIADKILFSILAIIVIAFILLFCKMRNGIGEFNIKIFGITTLPAILTHERRNQEPNAIFKTNV